MNRIVIILSLIVGLTFHLKSQLPTACTQSWVRYAAVPDPLMSTFGVSHYNWIIDGKGVKDFRVYGNGDSIDILWGNRPGRFAIGISEISELGCIGDTLWNYVMVSGTILDIGQDVELCENDSFMFNAGNDFVSYEWKYNITEPIFRGKAVKTDTIWITATNAFNCKISDTAIVLVRPKPVVDITDMASGRAFNDTMLCGISSITLDAGMGGLFYTWNTGDITSTITVSAIDPTSSDSLIYYTVRVENLYGCVSNDSVALIRCVPPEVNTIPNVFTPNGDGKNDKWIIPGFVFYPRAKVQVYDRWNRLVYESISRNYKPWDGTFNGKDLPIGAYYFIITGIGKEVKGNVVILR